MECGHRLEGRCPSCDSPVIDGARFCGECGTALDTGAAGGSVQPAEHIPERRLVTVLFADMVGYSTMSEARDPEEVRDFLSTYFATARDVIGRYGGTVDKFIGDAVMGVWGTPVAHEDDAERAVRAALDLADEVGLLGGRAGIPDIAVRVGVATGEAAVFLNAPAGEGMAGDLVNTASRLEGAATPGTVLVNDGTYRAASRAISFEDAGDLMLKGKAQAVHAWRPLQVTAKVGGTGRSAMMEPPFVGRNRELQTLRDIFKRSAAEGRAHLVSVIGVAGIGKSRLVDELEKYLDGLVDTTFWHRGRSPSYGEGVTFWALGEMVRTRARIADSDDPDTQREKLSETVQRFVDEADRDWVLTSLEVLLGLRAAGSVAAGEAEAGWRRFFESIADVAPTVMVFEDLHWADTGTIEFVESMLGWSRRSPIFIVTLSRPELLERQPTWGAGLSGFTGLSLEPLEDEEVHELLDGMAPGLPMELKRAVTDRAEGVPLYVVETVRMLADAGTIQSAGGTFEVTGPVELSVPESLHALVAARLDSLGVDDRRLLQHAAVFGQTFELKSLAEIVGVPPAELGPRLERLVVRQLLRVDDDPRSVEHGFHQFVQSVIREVALGTIARSERRDLHLRIADHYEKAGDVELLSVVVHHLTEAMRLGSDEEAAPLASRAFDLLNQAAERAGSLGSHDQELSFLERALPLAPDPVTRAHVTRAVAVSAQLAGRADRSLQAWRDAHEGFRDLGRHADEAQAASGLGNSLLMSGRIEEAGAVLDEAVSRAEEASVDRGIVAELIAQVARVGGFRAEGAGALAASERALEMASETGRVDVIADALITRAWGLNLIGRDLEAGAVNSGALWLAISEGLPQPEFRARNNLGAYKLWSDPEEILSLMTEGMERALRRGDIETHASLGSKAVEAAVSLGEWDLIDETLDGIVRTGISQFSKHQLDAFEGAYLSRRGDFERADALLRQARAMTDETESSQAIGVFHIYAGLAEWARGNFAGFLDNTIETERYLPAYSEHRMGLAAVAAGDRDALRSTISSIGGRPVLDDRTAAWLEVMQACAAVMDGDSSAASRVLESVQWMKKQRFVLDAGDWLTALTLLLPADSPDAMEAKAEAQEIWTALGAKAMLDLLDRTSPA